MLDFSCVWRFFLVVFSLTSQPTFVVCFRKIFYFFVFLMHFYFALFSFQGSVLKLDLFSLNNLLLLASLNLASWWAQCGQVHLFPSFFAYIIPWWAQVDSNHRPHAYQACALTTWAMRPFVSLGCVLPFLMSCGGDEEVRTLDPLRARQVLSQLSYTPINFFSLMFQASFSFVKFL